MKINGICPFCGSIHAHHIIDSDRKMAYVKCDDCNRFYGRKFEGLDEVPEEWNEICHQLGEQIFNKETPMEELERAMITVYDGNINYDKPVYHLLKVLKDGKHETIDSCLMYDILKEIADKYAWEMASTWIDSDLKSHESIDIKDKRRSYFNYMKAFMKDNEITIDYCLIKLKEGEWF